MDKPDAKLKVRTEIVWKLHPKHSCTALPVHISDSRPRRNPKATVSGANRKTFKFCEENSPQSPRSFRKIRPPLRPNRANRHGGALASAANSEYPSQSSPIVPGRSLTILHLRSLSAFICVHLRSTKEFAAIHASRCASRRSRSRRSSELCAPCPNQIGVAVKWSFNVGCCLLNVGCFGSLSPPPPPPQFCHFFDSNSLIECHLRIRWKNSFWCRRDITLFSGFCYTGRCDGQKTHHRRPTAGAPVCDRLSLLALPRARVALLPKRELCVSASSCGIWSSGCSQNRESGHIRFNPAKSGPKSFLK